jgi:hypothetical protein
MFGKSPSLLLMEPNIVSHYHERVPAVVCHIAIDRQAQKHCHRFRVVNDLPIKNPVPEYLSIHRH